MTEFSDMVELLRSIDRRGAAMTQYEEILAELQKMNNTLEVLLVMLTERLPKRRHYEYDGPAPIALRRFGEPAVE